VTANERKERVMRLINLSDRKHMLLYESHLGCERKVLFEGDKKHNRIFGWTDNYIRVETGWDEKLVNCAVAFRLEKINSDGNVDGTII